MATMVGALFNMKRKMGFQKPHQEEVLRWKRSFHPVTNSLIFLIKYAKPRHILLLGKTGSCHLLEYHCTLGELQTNHYSLTRVYLLKTKDWMIRNPILSLAALCTAKKLIWKLKNIGQDHLLVGPQDLTALSEMAFVQHVCDSQK